MRLNERGAYYMSTDTNYTSKAITTQITATYRMSIKIHDNFHTVEYTEQRTIPDAEHADIKKEKQLLWSDVVEEIENQVDDIIASYKK